MTHRPWVASGENPTNWGLLHGWPAVCEGVETTTHNAMTPIDPVETTRVDPRNSMAPPYVDEDPNGALVELGLDVAEDEARDAVADDYEASARLSDDSSEELDDIDYESSEGAAISPEVAAMHEETVPEDDEDDIG